MAYFYYPIGGELRQVEADRFTQATGGNDGSLGIIYSTGFEYRPHGITSDPLTTPVVAVRNYSIASTTATPTGFTITYEACDGSIVVDGYYPDSLEIPRTGVCGGCQTLFYVGNTIVLTLSRCPEIFPDERNEGCTPCCQQLLPIARRLRI